MLANTLAGSVPTGVSATARHENSMCLGSVYHIAAADGEKGGQNLWSGNILSKWSIRAKAPSEQQGLS